MHRVADIPERSGFRKILDKCFAEKSSIPIRAMTFAEKYVDTIAVIEVGELFE
jgi:hypothetical protein